MFQWHFREINVSGVKMSWGGWLCAQYYHKTMLMMFFAHRKKLIYYAFLGALIKSFRISRTIFPLCCHLFKHFQFHLWILLKSEDPSFRFNSHNKNLVKQHLKYTYISIWKPFFNSFAWLTLLLLMMMRRMHRNIIQWKSVKQIKFAIPSFQQKWWTIVYPSVFVARKCQEDEKVRDRERETRGKAVRDHVHEFHFKFRIWWFFNHSQKSNCNLLSLKCVLYSHLTT